MEQALENQTVLMERYTVTSCENRQTYCINYTATDNLNGMDVAINEFFPPYVIRKAGGEEVITAGRQSVRFNEDKKCFTEQNKKLKELNYIPVFAQIYDIFTCNNTVYVVTNLLEGYYLSEILARKKIFTVSDTQAAAFSLLRALKIAHSAGVFHGAISPENVFVTADGYTKLVNFAFGEFTADDDIAAVGSLMFEMLSSKSSTSMTLKSSQRELKKLKVDKKLQDAVLSANGLVGSKKIQSAEEFLSLIMPDLSVHAKRPLWVTISCYVVIVLMLAFSIVAFNKVIYPKGMNFIYRVTGSESVIVPNVIGMNLDKAQQELKSLKLNAKVTNPIKESPNAKKVKVQSQKPAGNTKVNAKSDVVLTLSAEKQEKENKRKDEGKK